MPGTVYVPVTATDRGVAPGAGVTPAATFEVTNGGRMFLRVTTTANATLTVTNKTTVDGLAGSNLAVVMTGAVTRYIGPFPPGVFNNVSGNIECALDTPGNVSVCEAVQLS